MKLFFYLLSAVTLFTTSSLVTLKSSEPELSTQKGKYVYFRATQISTSKSPALHYYSTVAFVADDGSYGSLSDNTDKLKNRFLKIIARDFGIKPDDWTKVDHYDYDSEKSANTALKSSLPRPDELIEL